jgi:hypothetical protein
MMLLRCTICIAEPFKSTALTTICQPPCLRANQIAENSLYGVPMDPPRVLRELGHRSNSKCNIWASANGGIHQGTNGGVIRHWDFE